jgi:hypothetical protein
VPKGIYESDTRGRYERSDEHRQMVSEKYRARSHGMVGTGIYTSWYAMKRRVKSPQPKDEPYYAGVSMDPRWELFEWFYADMGDRPKGKTLDRIDPDLGYWPDNCCWATHSEQRLNQRRSKRP